MRVGWGGEESIGPGGQWDMVLSGLMFGRFETHAGCLIGYLRPKSWEYLAFLDSSSEVGKLSLIGRIGDMVSPS